MANDSEPKDSILGIFRSAIDIEKFGIRYYQSLMTVVEDVTGKEMLEYLINAERKHQSYLEQEYDKYKELGLDSLKPLPLDNLDEEGRLAIFAEKLDEYKPEDVGIEAAIKFGINVEQRSIDFYSAAALLMHDFELEEKLNELVKFEEEHLELLQKNFSQFLKK
jgi:rubrerythrin